MDSRTKGMAAGAIALWAATGCVQAEMEGDLGGEELPKARSAFWFDYGVLDEPESGRALIGVQVTDYEDACERQAALTGAMADLLTTHGAALQEAADGLLDGSFTEEEYQALLDAYFADMNAAVREHTPENYVAVGILVNASSFQDIAGGTFSILQDFDLSGEDDGAWLAVATQEGWLDYAALDSGDTSSITYEAWSAASGEVRIEDAAEDGDVAGDGEGDLEEDGVEEGQTPRTGQVSLSFTARRCTEFEDAYREYEDAVESVYGGSSAE